MATQKQEMGEIAQNKLPYVHLFPKRQFLHPEVRTPPLTEPSFPIFKTRRERVIVHKKDFLHRKCFFHLLIVLNQGTLFNQEHYWHLV